MGVTYGRVRLFFATTLHGSQLLATGFSVLKLFSQQTFRAVSKIYMLSSHFSFVFFKILFYILTFSKPVCPTIYVVLYALLNPDVSNRSTTHIAFGN